MVVPCARMGLREGVERCLPNDTVADTLRVSADTDTAWGYRGPSTIEGMAREGGAIRAAGSAVMLSARAAFLAKP